VLSWKVGALWGALAEGDRSALVDASLASLAACRSPPTLRAAAELVNVVRARLAFNCRTHTQSHTHVTSSQVAQCASGDGPLLSRVLACAGAAAAAPDAAHRAAGCALLASLVDSIGGRLAPHYAELCALLAPRLDAAEAGPVRASAARAATALVSSWCMAEEHAPAARLALLPPLLRALRAAAAHGSHGDGDADAAGAEALAAAARSSAPLFAPHDASDAAHAALTLAAAPGAPLALRLQALQLLCALCEAASPGVVSAAVLAASAISATLTSLCAPPPGMEEDDDAAQLCEAVADALGAMATALPERAGVFSPVLAAVAASHEAAAAASQHGHGHGHATAAGAAAAVHARVASLRALAAVAEPCRAAARPPLNDTLLPAAAAALASHNPLRVRAAAADALLALIIALPADVSLPPACGGILGVASAAASGDPDATLRASAAGLIARLAAEMATDDVSPHLEGAVAALLSGLGPNSCGALRAACAEALASLAACALDDFEPFAAACAGALAPLLSAPPGSASEDDIRGRAAATTALGAVMTAGGPALCAAAWDGASAAAVEGFASGRGELRTAAHVFFMRVARAADEGFAPHLPSAVGAALASAGAAAAEAAAAAAAADAAALRAGGGAARRAPPLTVHTGGVEEACAAAEALGAYASATGSAFLPYLSDALRALDALLSHPHPGVRAASARALPLALAPLRAAAATDADNAAAGAQLACRLLSRLAGVVCADAVPEVVAEACAAAADVAYAAVSSGAASHSADVAATVHATLAALDAVIEGTTACQADARASCGGGGDDDDEEDDEDVHAELAATAEDAKGAIMHAVQRAASGAPAPGAL
jgi:SWI/SNF-related matrix-associated actin-dependent regulator 1 of chromatin subfamily A